MRRDRPLNGRHGGGVCIYIKNNLNFRSRTDLSNENLELTAIEIRKPHSRPFVVVTWYRPPNSQISTFSAIQDVIDRIDCENIEFYLLGDFNCDMLAEMPDNSTIQLRNIASVYDLTQVISQPTRITSTSVSLIDLCYTNFPDKVYVSGTHSLGISDHSRKSNHLVGDINHPVRRRKFNNFIDEDRVSERCSAGRLVKREFGK